jgi:pyridoxal phosphate enzyme (YggS family)
MGLKENLITLEKRIAAACARANRNREEITLLAVTKNHPAEKILDAYNLGIRNFGENKVQELLRKKEFFVNLPDLRWHFIGHLQSNKAKYIAPFIHCIHSIDSIETAKELSKRAGQNSRSIDVLLEINVASEATKEGIALSDGNKLFRQIRDEAKSLNVKGLMTVAPLDENPETVRPYFKELRILRDQLGLKELSMGMTSDFEIAIEEGATQIRIGSALFGERIAND